MVSTLRPLICCSSEEGSSLRDCEHAKNIMDMSPPAFCWVSRGLQEWTSPCLVGVEIDIVAVREKG